jgi:two-component system, NtrC family, response regulator HydG
MPAPEPLRRVLVVDDKVEFAETVADGLMDHGYEAVALGSGKAALTRLEHESFDALVTDLRMPDLDGLELVTASRNLSPDRPVIVMTAFGGIESAIESIRRGAYHYLTKPFSTEELLIFLGRALEEVRVRKEAAALKTTLGERFGSEGIVGKSKAIREALDVVHRVAKTDVPVLITGETGSGKGLWARALHLGSPRANRPFVTINCAALPESLLESELFGHVKGAFTGAVGNHTGLFVDADGGTLFLDEIGEMTPGLQAKLLRVLEAGVVRPVGATKERKVDVRIITATHRDLRELVSQGKFREDLVYRLDVVSIELPPLRHRREDIPELVDHFLQAARDKYESSPVERFSPEALARLLDHPWPGNVRELSHVVERVVVLGKHPVVAAEDLPSTIGLPSNIAGPLFRGEVMPIRELQTRYATWALEQLNGHKGRTAERLGVDAKTLSKWLSRPSDETEPEAAASETEQRLPTE